jgi:hypothetical protein
VSTADTSSRSWVDERTREKFRDASRRLEAARSAYAKAQTELINAQEKYNDASRAYGRTWMGSTGND